MQNFDLITACWKNNKVSSQSAIAPAAFQQLIGSRLRKQQALIRQYFFASGFWQWLIYASLLYLMFRFWDDRFFQLVATGMILLYVPFTIIFINRFKQMQWNCFGLSKGQDADIRHNLYRQRGSLRAFYTVKRAFDWFTVPVCCGLITLISVKFQWIPSPSTSWLPAVILFGVYFILFIAATVYENRKHFAQPLQNLDAILDELEHSS